MSDLILYKLTTTTKTIALLYVCFAYWLLVMNYTKKKQTNKQAIQSKY